MKNTILLTLALAFVATSTAAQDLEIVDRTGEVRAFALAGIDSITFGSQAIPDIVFPAATGDILNIHTTTGAVRFAVPRLTGLSIVDTSQLVLDFGDGSSSAFDLADVDSLSFADSSDTPVSVTWSGTTVAVDNPLADVGIAVDVSGADVTVNATGGLGGVRYHLGGATADGMFKVYGDGDFTLRLDGVQITNLDGPAINIQADETIGVELPAGTVSRLVDGTTYSDPPGDEDQKGAFFSEGQLLIGGEGEMVVSGRGDDQHGLVSDDFIAIHGGTVTVTGATKDGIHTNEGFYLVAGSVDVAADGDGIDGGDGPVVISSGTLAVLCAGDDKDAVKCDGELRIDGGDVVIDVRGDQSKGLNAGTVVVTDGTVHIDTSGGVVLEASGAGFDPSYCSAIKADDLVRIAGGQVEITTGGEAGRGISCDGDIEMTGGLLAVTSSGGGGTYVDENGVTDAYHGPCIKTDGDCLLQAGDLVLSHTGSGGRGLSVDGDLAVGTVQSAPTIQVTTSGAAISTGFGEATEAKAITVDSLITITDGVLTLSSPDDAIKSKKAIVIDGGTIDIVQSLEGIEAPFLTINGGAIHVTSTDDGLNTTFGVDGEADDGSEMVINGGYVAVNAPAGDGLDSNGTLSINGGTLVVHGPPSQPEVGIDVNGVFLVNGGVTVVSQVNSFMNEVPHGASSQYAVLIRTNQTLAAGTLFHVEDASGNPVLTFAPARNYSSVLLSTPALAAGTTYRVSTGGSCTPGTATDGIYGGGTYSGGTLRTSFAFSGTVLTVTF